MRLMQQNVGRTFGTVHEEDQDLIIIKSVDITGQCPNYATQQGEDKPRLLLNFGQTRKGITVQLVEHSPGVHWADHAYQGTTDGGSCIFHNLRDMDHVYDVEYGDVTDHFKALARRAGIIAGKLANIIKCVAPPIDREKMIEAIRRGANNPDMSTEEVIEALEQLGVSTEGLVA